MSERDPGEMGNEGRVREAANTWLPTLREALAALRRLPLMDGLYGEYWRNRWRMVTEARIGMAQRLPRGSAPALDAALAVLREEGGLGQEFHCWITAREDVPHPGMARRKGAALEFLLTPSALVIPSRAGLVARLALLAYDALEDDAPFLRFLMGKEAALPLSARLAALDHGRWHDYMAACFACRCAGDARAAAAAAFQRRTELDPAVAGLDLRALAEGTLALGGLKQLALVEGGPHPAPYFAATPLVLDLFEQTPFRRDDPRAPLTPTAFAAQVLELDRRMHPAWTEAPPEQRSFVLLATFLAAQALIKNLEFSPLERRQRVLQFLETTEETMRRLARECGVTPWNEEEPVDQLGELLEGPRHLWANIHSVQILKDCLRLAEGAGGMGAEYEITQGLNPLCYVELLRIGRQLRVRRADLKLMLDDATSGQADASAELFRV